jgi:hypothetical protein
MAIARTMPPDFAADQVCEELAEKIKFNSQFAKDVGKEKEMFSLFFKNVESINNIYSKFSTGIELNQEELDLIEFFRNIFNLSNKKIIPITQIKIPSTLHGKDEPKGIQNIITFTKLVTILGGKIMFADESDEIAPRSLEVVYNIFAKLSKVEIDCGDFFNQKGQNGTLFENIKAGDSLGQICIKLLNPQKYMGDSITDDLMGVIPTVSIEGYENGTVAGLIKITENPYLGVDPEGLKYLDKIWSKNLEINKFLPELIFSQD